MTVSPMLLSTALSEPTGGDWVLEPKWDGFRFLYRLAEKGQAMCWTRHGNRHDRKLPYIDAELRDLFPNETLSTRSSSPSDGAGTASYAMTSSACGRSSAPPELLGRFLAGI